MSAAAGVFVTGTGTDVGKSVVAAAIANTASRNGRAVAVYKPALSGLDEGGEADHEFLRRASGSNQSDDEIAPYRFGPAVSPHLAAERAGEAIEQVHLLQVARAAGQGADLLVCEGVGGLMVPLTSEYLVRNLAADLGYPLVIAASPDLGTINHALLTIEAAWAAELEVRAVVLTPWPDEPTDMQRSNLETIAALGGVEVLTLDKLDLGKPESWPELDLG